MDVNELKFLGKFKKKILGGGLGSRGGLGWGVRVDVNEERRIEVFVKIQKKKFFFGGGGGGGGVGSVGGGGSGWM